MRKFKQHFNDIINISRDVDWAIASESIRKSLFFKGSNVWILAADIIVTSIGLNVNSIPVDDEVVAKLQKWLSVRLETDNITVIQDTR